MKTRLLGMSLAVACFLIVPALRAAEHTTDQAPTIKENIKEQKAILVDVREKKEWDAGHVEGAKLFPLSQLSKADADAIAKELPKDKIIYCHCRAGGRALAAGQLLEKLGYDVRPLKPGFDDLIELGFPKAK